MQKNETYSPRPIAVAMAMAIAMAASPAFAATVGPLFGGTGQAGSNSTTTSGPSSGLTPASTDADAVSDDSDNKATATGGAGGAGGSSTIRPFVAAAGATGGSASGVASYATGSTNSTDEGTATGGVGGAGGSGAPSAGRNFPGGTGGAGGAGGSALVAGAAPPNHTGTTSVTLVGTGGAGGTGGTGGLKSSGLGNQAGTGGKGGDGGVATIGALSGGGTDLTLQGTLTGGDGGMGGSPGSGGSVSGAGGNGGAAIFSQNSQNGPIVATASNSLTILQTLIGGSGGFSNGNPGGAGGEANGLYASFGPSGSPALYTFSGATFGGAGGITQSGNAGAGGTATLEEVIGAPHRLTISASANAPVSGYSGPLGQGGNVNFGPGNGGAGGNGVMVVTAQSADTGFSGASAVTATDTAFGGNGGSVMNGAAGNGGAGGMAVINSDVRNAGSDAVSLTATATSGNGGQGAFTGFTGGNGGGIRTDQFIEAQSAHGGVSLNFTAAGGSGGNGINGANGGNGAGVTLADTITSNVHTTTLGMAQSAIAGNGGSADGAATGAAGDAFSSINQAANGVTSTLWAASAIGGGGGNNINANGGAGGNATALLTLTSTAAHVTGVASANYLSDTHDNSVKNVLTGGKGSGATANFVGGDGGNATATANVTSTSTATSDWGPEAQALAIGQDGGAGTDFVNLAHAGNATATATAAGVGPGDVFAIASAIGGASGRGISGLMTSPYGPSGNAVATATAVETSTGEASAQATGTSSALAPSDTPGNALVNAAAIGVTGADAQAAGLALTGQVTATAQISPQAPGLITMGRAVMSGPPEQVSIQALFADAAIGNRAFNISDEGRISIVALAPAASDLQTAWANDTNVQQVLASPANVVVLGSIGFQDINSKFAPVAAYSSRHDLALNPSVLSSDDVVLGFLHNSRLQDPVDAGDPLRLRVLRDGVAVLDQMFISDAAVQSFFNDSILDLGAGANGTTANLQLVQVLLDYTVNKNTHLSYTAQYVLGVAAPASHLWLGGDATWINPANWQNRSVPDGPGLTASFAAPFAEAITLDQAITLGSLQLSGGPVTITSGNGGSIAFNSNQAAASSLHVAVANHTLAAPITFAPQGLNISIDAGILFSLSANITGPGQLFISGPGVAQFLPSTGTTKIASLQLGRSAEGPTAPFSSTLDLANNRLIIQSPDTASKASAISFISTAITSGKNGGAWNGTGITSNTVLLNNSGGNPHNQTLALVDAAELFSATNGIGTFGGQTTDANSLFITPALIGDADLNGTVDFNDLVTVAHHFNQTNLGWANGNFDLTDGSTIVDFNDLVAVAHHFNQTFSLTPDLNSAIAAYDTTSIPVPEPASLTLLTLLAPLLLRRLRRNVHNHQILHFSNISVGLTPDAL